MLGVENESSFGKYFSDLLKASKILYCNSTDDEAIHTNCTTPKMTQNYINKTIDVNM